MQQQKIVIFQLPNRGRDEFLPLKGDPCWDVQWVEPRDYNGDARVIILPGSGRTVDDLAYLRQQGGAEKIRRHLSMGGLVVGVCGGLQILGAKLLDPYLKQGEEKEVDGLGYLPITSMFGPEMLNCESEFELLVGKGKGGIVKGVEHRSGYSWLNVPSEPQAFAPLNKVVKRTCSQDEQCPQGRVLAETNKFWAPGSEEVDGLVSSDRQVWGTYLHLIFHNEAFRETFFARLACQ